MHCILLLATCLCTAAAQAGYSTNVEIPQSAPLVSSMVAPGSGPSYNVGPTNGQRTIVLNGNRRLISHRILKGQEATMPSNNIERVEYHGPLQGRRVTVYRKIVRPVKIKSTYYITHTGPGTVIDQWVDPQDAAPAPQPQPVYQAPVNNAPAYNYNPAPAPVEEQDTTGQYLKRYLNRQ